MVRRRASVTALVLSVWLAAVGCGDPFEIGADGAPENPHQYTIRVGGSDDVYPLLETLAQEFEKQNVSCELVFAPQVHTHGGVGGVAAGELDIGLLSRPMSAAERQSKLTHLHLAEDIVVFAIHHQVGVRELRSEQLRAIYTGDISSWKQLGGLDLPITVLDLAEPTSLKIAVRRLLLGDETAVTPRATLLARPADMVTSLGMLEGAIGYLSLADVIREDLDVTVLAVDGIEPRPLALRSSSYPYTRPFGLLVGPQPSEATMRFVSFVYSEAGRELIAGQGFLPVTMDLVIAVLPEQDLLSQEQRYAPLIEYLSRHLGMQTTVELRLLPSYGEVIEELGSGRSNAAFLGSMAFALAAAQVGVTPIVRPEKDGVSQYRGLIVTRKDSGITDWRGLRGKRFGMVDPGTTAGYIYPLIYLHRHGITKPDEFFGEVVFTGSHDLLFSKVHDGELDAGAAKDLMLEEVAKDRPGIIDDLRILDSSPPVPNNAFVISGNLSFPCLRCHASVPEGRPGTAISPPRRPQEVNELLRQLLLHLHESAEGRLVLEALGADRFVTTTDADRLVVDGMIREAGFDPARYHP